MPAQNFNDFLKSDVLYIVETTLIRAVLSSWCAWKPQKHRSSESLIQGKMIFEVGRAGEHTKL